MIYPATRLSGVFLRQGIFADGGLEWCFFLFVVILLGFLLPQRFLRGEKLSQIQYITTMVLLLLMLGIVIKMGARLGFNIKYIFSLPLLNFNI